MAEHAKYEGWVVLELMGHRRLGGYLSEETIAGASFVRIDVPDPTKEGDHWQATHFYSPAAVYCITPTTRDLAFALARTCSPSPVQRWELPALESHREAVGQVRPSYGTDDDAEGRDEPPF